MLKKRAPIFHKLSNTLRISVLVSKMRKRRPVINPSLVYIKKSRNLRRFRLLNSYQHFLDQDYGFSPSHIGCGKRIHFKKQASYYKDRVCSVLFMCGCLGGFRRGGVALPLDRGASSAIVPAREFLQPVDLWDDDDEEEEESVDERAERFIERFYQQMIMQRQHSV
ncbi:uncharacterized protein LOC126674352 [Mercurialis annua]|uniref:uncharacterized protein LOC126674352 n=1 Tax=Mercurialis annua TaxID=3986 RepID=UPI00216071DF|nr:uncharacterized protein LOC126674352 [Mercurialis annua]